MMSTSVSQCSIVGAPSRALPCRSHRSSIPRTRHRVVRVSADISDFSPEFAAGLRASVPDVSSPVSIPVPESLESLSSLPPEVLLGIGAAAVALVGLVAFLASRGGGEGGAPSEAGGAAPARGIKLPTVKPVPRENAVLVFGSTGKLGRLIVAELLKAGKTVVAAARDGKRASSVFEGEMGLKAGLQSGGGALIIDSGVDITSPETLGESLWKGVTQVVLAVGPVFGKLPDGKMGYLDNLTSERVDAEGVTNVAEALKAAVAERAPKAEKEVSEVLSMRTGGDLEKWERLDDVIMGGQSSSRLEPEGDMVTGEGAIFSGDLILEGGGFCGARTKQPLDLDLGKYDGVALRVKGDGQTFKLNLKTADQENVPEATFQATFDTVPGEWTTLYLPWHEFVPVNKAMYDPASPPLDPAKVRQLGLVLSRFAFNRAPNPNYRAGKFTLEIHGGIKAYTEPAPTVVIVTSAAVERNALIGDDVEKRKKDIPIVQLNPGGTLNHKYAGEMAIRTSGLPYTVIRATGLTNENPDTPFLIEASQGDRIAGKISRPEVASLVATALSTPGAVGKTVEVRRSEAMDAKGVTPTPTDLQRLFWVAVEDRHRPRIGLLPMPAPVPPPPSPTEERTKEILADSRVQAAAAAERGGRVRDVSEAAEAKSVTVVGDGRAAASGNGRPPAAADARAWIERWRAKSGNGVPAATNGKAAAPPAAAAEVPANVKEARDWIRSWRAKNLEKGLVKDTVAAK